MRQTKWKRGSKDKGRLCYSYRENTSAADAPVYYGGRTISKHVQDVSQGLTTPLQQITALTWPQRALKCMR